MAYGYRDRASAASAAAVQRALARAAGTWGGYRAWRPAVAQRLIAAEQASEPVPIPAPAPAPNPAPNPANDASLGGPRREQFEPKKGYFGHGS